jgi:hypothetical protein
MNQNQTAMSSSIVKTAKLILFKCVPLTMASLFATSAFAEKPDCPTISDIRYKFVSGGNFVTENSSTDWKLSYGGDSAWRAIQQHEPLGLVSVRAKAIIGAGQTEALAQEQHLKRVECIYRGSNSHAPDIILSIDAKSALYKHVERSNAKWNRAGYRTSVGKIKGTAWASHYDGAEYNRTCPKRDVNGNPLGSVDNCTFDFEKKEQDNGYWQDALYRCWNFSVCSTMRGNMDSVVGTCKELTCTDEIIKMNEHVQAAANKMYYGVGDAWYLCWWDNNWKNDWNVKLIADQSTNHLTKIRVYGTLKWDFNPGDGAYSWSDVSTQRGMACNHNTDGTAAPLFTEFWPDYSYVGYKKL